MNCNHDFITVLGDKFYCPSCKESMEHLPGEEPMSYSQIDVRDLIEGFKDGILTLSEGAEAINISVKEFSDIITKTFRPKMEFMRQHSISGPTQLMSMSTTPARTSSPLMVEETLANPNPNKSVLEQLSDVTSVVCNYRANDHVTWNVTFIDESIQLVNGYRASKI